MENQTQTQPINYKAFKKFNFSNEVIDLLVKEFNSGQTIAQVKQNQAKHFENKNFALIYPMRGEMIRQGLIERTDVAKKMVETKKRLKKQAERRAAKMALQEVATVLPKMAPKISTIKENVSNSMIKIDFHGTIIQIEKTSNIIITKDQIVVR